MLILIPINANQEIVSQHEAAQWALIAFEEGAVKATNFFATKEEMNAPWIDFVILANKFENYLEYMEAGTMVLVVRHEKHIDDIMEAFKFKELDEVGM
ncbi:MAG: hypothetical protein JXQ76_03475 [Campylobacterales bacterium]|nr:hypothetical protein [Campylobacterales bacterium]